ncbi:MAG: 2-oxoacid:acceptor oxidoreductase family protein [Candidatus Delongbacteria bacterium]|nr:2-oxoacid:acceptor oxidoreductase family protein [Candidatus Delongbacteria bacterium]
METLKLQTPRAFYTEFVRRPGSDKKNTHYCPGCGHGIVHKLLAEAIDDFGIRDRTIIISPVGCSVFVYYYLDTGNVQVAHGRAQAVATAVKRAHPDSIVISYQGDGDLAAIGGNHLIQAANRGENITVIFINNAIYGMTGGQMAPTTLLGQKTLTSPFGRKVEEAGYPMRVCELLATLPNTAYLERVALHNAANIAKTRKAIRKGIQNQMENKGYSLIEVLSQCPSGWKMDAPASRKFIEEKMVPYYPLGIYKDTTAEREFHYIPKQDLDADSMQGVLGLNETAPSADYSTQIRRTAYQNPQIRIAGFGGQGIMLLGEALAEIAMLKGYHVSWIPSYGPEMRGGTAYCQVNISERRIGSPLTNRPDVLIAMNKPSLQKFGSTVRPGGLIFYNTSLIDIPFDRPDCEVIPVPFTELAEQAGSPKAANMVVLGAYAYYTGILPVEMVKDLLPRFITKKDLIGLNQKAVEAGMNAVKPFIKQD